MIVKETGMSYDEMARLNRYWKCLLLGYREPRQATKQDISEFVRKFSRKRPSASGWRTG